MSTYTKRRHNPGGRIHGRICTEAQAGVGLDRRADPGNLPFPNKPVSLRKSRSLMTQGSLDLYEFEKISITHQPRGRLSPQESCSNGWDTTGSVHTRKDAQKQPRGELEMSRAIQEKQLMLQEKLWRVEAKLRQSIQSTREGEVQDMGEAERGKCETINEQIKQMRDSERSTRGMMQDRKQEDVKQQTMKERMRNAHEEEEERARWEKRGKGAHETAAGRQELSGRSDKLRRENVKEQTRGRGRFEKDGGTWGERERKLMERAKEGEHSTFSRGDQEYAGRFESEEQCLPAASGSSDSNRQQAEPSHADGTGEDLQRLPCRVCNRKFVSDRLEKHVQICERVKNTNRQVFNSFANRTKGCDVGEYLKTHSRSRTPQVLQEKKQRQSNTANTKNLLKGQPTARTSNQSK